MTPEEIAAGLTKGQRNAMRGRIVYISKRDALIGKGLLTPRGGTNWTPLGLSVIAHMEKQDGR